jgi:hypothetical protein
LGHEVDLVDADFHQDDVNHLAPVPHADPSNHRPSRLERQPSTGWEGLRETIKSPAFDDQRRKKAWREQLQKCVNDMRALLFSNTASAGLDLTNEEIDLFAKIFDVQFASNLEEYSESFFDTLKYQEIRQVAKDIQGHLADVVSRIEVLRRFIIIT